MQRLILLILAALCLVTWTAALLLFRSRSERDTIVIPTLMVLPSVTPSSIPLPTSTPTEPLTPTATVTPSPTFTLEPTLTSTLSERVREIIVVMPGVQVEPTHTPLPPQSTLIPAPPNPVEPLPDATHSAPPFTGWYSFESDNPAVSYIPAWTPRLSPTASRGQYHRTEAVYGSAFFTFEGEGLRVRYVAARNMGVFEIIVDGVVIDSVDAYAPELAFLGTHVYALESGVHRLEIRTTGRKNNLSEGYVTGLDAVQVFRADAMTLIVPRAAMTSTPTAEPREITQIELVSAPPTIQPTATPIPPRVMTAAVVIAYDENGNRSVDPAEGVVGISVRVVEITTNRVIASGFTDERGYVEFALVTDSPAQLVVPYFGKVWEVQRSSGGSSPAYTLLLTPGNQPGLIP